MARPDGYFRLGIPDAVQPPPGEGPMIDGVTREEDSADYLPSDALRAAVDVALILGRPLLLMGPPGTGKSELARAVAYWFGFGFSKFETKSSSEARDLFYTFDSLAAFRSPGEGYDARNYIRYQALGKAIIDAFPRSHPQVRELLGSAADDDHQPARTVVLIDEIDKAPRDFPNDLLNEIERLYFRVPELHNAISPGGAGDPIAADFRPVVIITSNDERGLPSAFLRRCAFFHIAFPDEQQIERIVAARMRRTLESSTATALPPALKDIIALFFDLRKSGGGIDGEGASTAELLDWIEVLLKTGLNPDRPLAEQADLLPASLPAIAKSGDALARASEQIQRKYSTRRG